ncbi:MAG: hypothetical protein LC099_00515 [Anaerolineales bacterium]|nr:hypothetical protein [Anaerolineales bacterium]
MEYRIVIEEHGGQRMAHTYIKGELSEEDRKRIGIEAIQTVRANGLSLSIWDLSEATITYSFATVHLAAAHPEAEGLYPQLCVAIVYGQNAEAYEHAKLVAANRGHLNISYFANLDEAIQWLISKGRAQ